MGCAPKLFSQINRSRFGSLQKFANEQFKLNLSGDVGTASDAEGKNVISWTYDESTQKLTLEVLKSPFPCFLVQLRISDFLASCP